eukprot:gene51945-61488_t
MQYGEWIVQAGDWIANISNSPDADDVAYINLNGGLAHDGVLGEAAR